jgi:hypothetical protein
MTLQFWVWQTLWTICGAQVQVYIALFRSPPLLFSRQELSLASDRDWSNTVVVASDELYFLVWTQQVCMNGNERNVCPPCSAWIPSFSLSFYPGVVGVPCTSNTSYCHLQTLLLEKMKEWAKELSMVSKFVYKLASETDSGLKFLVSKGGVPLYYKYTEYTLSLVLCWQNHLNNLRLSEILYPLPLPPYWILARQIPNEIEYR